MMVYLLRHGTAADRPPDGGHDDGRRELTPRGAEKLRRAGPVYSRLVGTPTRVVSSDYARAVQTAEIVVAALGTELAVERREHLRPDGRVARVLDEIAAAAAGDAWLLVGHEPHLGSLAGRLLTGSDHAIPLSKGMLVGIELDEPHAGLGRLRFALTPKAAHTLT